MACCRGGCSKAAASEVEASELEMDVLETRERSVKFAFRVPPAPRGQRLARGAAEEGFVVSVVGGPDADLRGAREEQITARCGATVSHEVVDLLPQTEYTIRVRRASESSSSASACLQGMLEIRTAEASTALLAGEDWGRLQGAGAAKGPSAFKQGDYEPSKGDAKKAPGGGAVFSGGSAWSGGAAAAAATPSGQGAADDASTIAPSDVPALRPTASREDSVDRMTSADDEDWVSIVSDSERPRRNMATSRDAAATSSAPEVGPQEAVAAEGASELRAIRQTEVAESSPAPRTPKCNLLSMLDCLKLSGGAQSDASELRVDAPESLGAPRDLPTEQAAAAAAAPPQAQSQRKFRPYRHPFPGRAVDPRSVGLEHLEAQNREALPPQVGQR